ncbi:hypothetical protein NEIG_00466 [Nematocida sp. ERTm5]|nr:hypothetical protein NEIG_00466 [Nematocida sp. ERTm5]
MKIVIILSILAIKEIFCSDNEVTLKKDNNQQQERVDLTEPKNITNMTDLINFVNYRNAYTWKRMKSIKAMSIKSNKRPFDMIMERFTDHSTRTEIILDIGGSEEMNCILIDEIRNEGIREKNNLERNHIKQSPFKKLTDEFPSLNAQIQCVYKEMREHIENFENYMERLIKEINILDEDYRTACSTILSGIENTYLILQHSKKVIRKMHYLYTQVEEDRYNAIGRHPIIVDEEKIFSYKDIEKNIVNIIKCMEEIDSMENIIPKFENITPTMFLPRMKELLETKEKILSEFPVIKTINTALEKEVKKCLYRMKLGNSNSITVIKDRYDCHSGELPISLSRKTYTTSISNESFSWSDSVVSIYNCNDKDIVYISIKYKQNGQCLTGKSKFHLKLNIRLNDILFQTLINAIIGNVVIPLTECGAPTNIRSLELANHSPIDSLTYPISRIIKEKNKKDCKYFPGKIRRGVVEGRGIILGPTGSEIMNNFKVKGIMTVVFINDMDISQCLISWYSRNNLMPCDIEGTEKENDILRIASTIDPVSTSVNDLDPTVSKEFKVCTQYRTNATITINFNYPNILLDYDVNIWNNPFILWSDKVHKDVIWYKYLNKKTQTIVTNRIITAENNQSAQVLFKLLRSRDI